MGGKSSKKKAIVRPSNPVSFSPSNCTTTCTTTCATPVVQQACVAPVVQQACVPCVQPQPVTSTCCCSCSNSPSSGLNLLTFGSFDFGSPVGFYGFGDNFGLNTFAPPLLGSNSLNLNNPLFGGNLWANPSLPINSFDSNLLGANQFNNSFNNFAPISPMSLF